MELLKDFVDGYERFGPMLLDFEYILLDVNRYTRQELLDKGTLMSSAFLMDQKMELEMIADRLSSIASILKSWDMHKFQLFNTWLCGIIIGRLPVEEREKVMSILQETNPQKTDFVASNLGDAITEGLERAAQKGKAEGKVEGKAEGKAEVVLDFLKSVGTVDDDLRSSIMNEKNSLILFKWVRYAARAQSIEEFKAKMMETE